MCKWSLQREKMFSSAGFLLLFCDQRQPHIRWYALFLGRPQIRLLPYQHRNIFHHHALYTSLKVNIMNSVPGAGYDWGRSVSWTFGLKDCFPTHHTTLPLVTYISTVCCLRHSLCQSQALLQWCWDSAGCGALDPTRLSPDRSWRTVHSESPATTWTAKN